MEIRSANQPPIEAAAPPKKAEPARPVEQRRAEQVAKAPDDKPAVHEKPRPVLNAQGQTIGTNINVSA
ncbi:MAG: hypothetical protein ACR2I0_12310 [Rhodoferax sp.]